MFFLSGIQIFIKKCPNYIFDRFCHKMMQKRKLGFSFIYFYSYGVDIYLKCTIVQPFNAKYTKIGSNLLKMSGFSFRNVRYPRYQDTGLLQLCQWLKMHQFSVVDTKYWPARHFRWSRGCSSNGCWIYCISCVYMDKVVVVYSSHTAQPKLVLLSILVFRQGHLIRRLQVNRLHS